VRVIKVEGEYRPCPVCKLKYMEQFPRGTTFTALRQWWGVTHVIPHKADCPKGYTSRMAEDE